MTVLDVPRALLWNSRVSRQLHALAFFLFGASLAERAPFSRGFWCSFPAVVLQTALACHFVIITNDIADVDVDRLCADDQNRPLVTGVLSVRSAWGVAFGCLAGALIVSVGLIGVHAAVATLLTAALYSVYSLPPLRLKAVPLLSKLVIAVCSLVYALYGFSHAGGTAAAFPFFVAAHLLVFGTLVANVIDLKDVSADRAAGIATLPVLLGARKTTWIVAASFAVGNVTLPLLLGHLNLAAIGAPLFSVVEWWLLVRRKPYREGLVFTVYLCSIFTLAIVQAS